jgi:hypothetical protein
MLNAVEKPTGDYESAVDALLETNIICGNFVTKSKRAIPIYEYVPNYETQTFDITKYTLHEIKRVARKRKTGINPAGIGKCIDELRIRTLKTTKIKPPVKPALFPLEEPDFFDKMENLKSMAEQ